MVWRALRRSGYTMKKVCKPVVILNKSNIWTIAYTSGNWMQHTEMSSLYLQDWPALSLQTAHFCWWELIWLPHILQGKGMGNCGTMGSSKGFLHSGEKVCLLLQQLFLLNYKQILCPSSSVLGWHPLCQNSPGSFTYDSFGESIDGLLDQMNPLPGHNSVIVMDNCHIHKSEEVLKRIIERWDGITLVTSLPNDKEGGWNMSFFHPTLQISTQLSQLSQLSRHIFVIMEGFSRLPWSLRIRWWPSWYSYMMQCGQWCLTMHGDGIIIVAMCSM